MNEDNDDEQTRRESGMSPSPSQGLGSARKNNRSSPEFRTPPGSTKSPHQLSNRSASASPREGCDDEESVGGSSDASLAYVQLDAYNVDPNTIHGLHESQKEYLSRVVRTQIFSKVKFLPKSGKEHEKLFGSFWKPDLLHNTPRYIDAILDNFADLEHRKEDESHLIEAVHFWMKATYLVRQVILDRRSNVTQRMKRELVVGVYNV